MFTNQNIHQPKCSFIKTMLTPLINMYHYLAELALSSSSNSYRLLTQSASYAVRLGLWLTLLVSQSLQAMADQQNQSRDKSNELSTINIAIFYDAEQTDSYPLLQSLKAPITNLYLTKGQTTAAQLKADKAQSPKLVTSYDINQLTISELKQKALQAKQCLLTLDMPSAKKMAALRLKKPIFALNLPRITLEKLHRVYQPLGVNISGIYQEQSFQRQLFLADAIDKNKKNIGLLLSQNDHFELSQYQKTAAEHSHSLNFRLLNAIESAQSYLAALFNTQRPLKASQQSSIPLKPEALAPNKNYLILTNNQVLYSAKKMIELVLMANRLNINLIGNTLQQSKNGALASVYLPQDALIDEALEDIKIICQQQKYRAPHFAKQYQVTINQQIARNSNFKNINQQVLLKEMRQAEKHWANTKLKQ